jgi:hypothetical protein
MQTQGGIERCFRSAIGDELDPLEQTAAADVADTSSPFPPGIARLL